MGNYYYNIYYNMLNKISILRQTKKNNLIAYACKQGFSNTKSNLISVKKSKKISEENIIDKHFSSVVQPEIQNIPN